MLLLTSIDDSNTASYLLDEFIAGWIELEAPEKGFGCMWGMQEQKDKGKYAKTLSTFADTWCQCTGESPCSACSSRGTPCAYDVAADQRRKIANQRNIQHLAETRLEVEKLSTLVAGIVAIIRADGGTSIPDLVSTIQSGMDLSQLSAHVRNTRRTVPRVEHAYQQIDKTIEEDGLPSPSELLSNVPFNLDPSLVGGSESSSTQQRVESPVNPRKRRHRSGRITDIVNPPIFVPAKPWTTVTDDDDFVSHLISLWFTWAHPWWHWVDEQAFMEAMHSGDLENPNCSPYLVNMILADSCVSFRLYT